MSQCRVTRKATRCGVQQEQAAVQPDTGCKPVSVCLGFGRRLEWDGNCYGVTGTPSVPDGWYGQVQVIDGCIVDAKDALLPIYTPAPCAPVAGACGDDTGGGGGSITLAPGSCNLLEFTSGMLQSKLYFGDHDGVTVEGCGTVNSPLTFSAATGSTAVYMKSDTPSVITLNGDGSVGDPFAVGMKTSPLAAGEYGAFELDAYGRVIGYNDESGTIAAVTDGNGVHLEVNSGVLSAELVEVPDVAGQKLLGGYTVTVDNTGRVTGFSQAIELKADEYQLGNYNVTINSYGSITKIEAINEDNSAVPDTFVGSFRGDSGSDDNTREMTITTQFAGPLHVEYRGMLGSILRNPGIAMTLPAGFGVAVDGISMADPLIEIAGVFTKDGTGANAIVAIRATTLNAVEPGQHTITITAPSSALTQTDGFMRVQIVGRGG